MKENQKMVVQAKMDAILKKFHDEKDEIRDKAREQMVKERNREIEAIIEKLGDETHDTQKQLMQQYEKKVAELDKKSAHELAEERVRYNELMDKYRGYQDEKSVLTENIRVLTSRVHDMEREMYDLKGVAEQKDTTIAELKG